MKSDSDSWAETLARIDDYHALGTHYAVAIDPQTRNVVERGRPPAGLHLDFDAIIDA